MAGKFRIRNFDERITLIRGPDKQIDFSNLFSTKNVRVFSFSQNFNFLSRQIYQTRRKSKSSMNFISDLDDQINYQLSMGKTSFAFECVFLLKNLYFAESCW